MWTWGVTRGSPRKATASRPPTKLEEITVALETTISDLKQAKKAEQRWGGDPSAVQDTKMAAPYKPTSPSMGARRPWPASREYPVPFSINKPIPGEARYTDSV